MAKEKPVRFDVSETVTVNSRTYFKGMAVVTETEKKMIQRELDRRAEERESEEESGEAEETTKYTKTQLKKMNVEQLTGVAKEELGLAIKENAAKADLIKLITDAQ